MFRKMRRYQQLLSQEESVEILRAGASGVLAVQGDNDYPYTIPLNYIYSGNKLYFHCAKAGHKLDAIQRQPKVSFCVISEDKIVPEEYTTYFRSVIVFGKAHILTDESEIKSAINALAMKYSPNDTEENRQKVIAREWKPLCMFVLEIEHMTGKEAMELVRANPYNQQQFRSEQ
ncbi:MAG: pyridoxamine 5'-phosphate oxidase family protein [Butyricicoccus pullicaecorum]|nr:pyridoxamine 5'-phosphate oxidase family protein [Butyricicoccus pullicaecorum]